MEDDFGPWSDFEIVDGTKKDDQVGVKQISTGKFISLDEMLTYPNYMIGEDAPEETGGELGEEEEKKQE